MGLRRGAGERVVRRRKQRNHPSKLKQKHLLQEAFPGNPSLTWLLVLRAITAHVTLPLLLSAPVHSCQCLLMENTYYYHY